MSVWDRFALMVTARKSWLLLAALAVVSVGLIGAIGGNDAAGEAPNSLPDAVQSARVEQSLAGFPDAGTASAVVVVSRADGTDLTVDDLTAARAAVARTVAAVGPNSSGGQARPDELITALDRKAAFGQVPVETDLSGFALTERVDRLRETVKTGLPPELVAQVTGGPAFGADIANSFSGANFTLLAVTVVVVAVLLIATYRSPVLWLVPLLVVGAADRMAASVGTGLARLTGLTFDGSTSGITSVLVFGAGTNYALLLVSRYRDELHGHPDHRIALRRAVRGAGPAILASNVTVVAALSVLLLASLPNTRSLGAGAAAGLLVAAVFVLLALPAVLALCGRNIFWPFVPRVDNRDTADEGIWHAIAARVVQRPIVVLSCVVGLLGVCAAGLLSTHVGLSQTEQFRVRAESVDGFDTLATHFPSGSSAPTIVVARRDAAAAVDRVLGATPGITKVTNTGTSAAGLTRWSVVIAADPASAQAFTAIESIRAGLADIPEADALVGGRDAQALDTRGAAVRDQKLVIPLILAVVMIVLLVLLRAVLASALLVAVSVVSALAALGLGGWISAHLFGFPALDTNVPLFAFLFSGRPRCRLHDLPGCQGE